ncbi:MAG: hypothetical protein HN568_06860 [Phycisphaerae bacterium]|jgi:hypothetical protein|nr:hypothetical protein [Phycisphaerae bacterium]
MSHLYLLGVATLTLTSASFAGSDTNADLQARLEAAETRISELSAVTNANWLNDTRADEIRGLVHDVLADADTRASLQGSGATAGYNGGFTVGSADGNWSLKINGLLQTRWTSVDNEAIVNAAGPPAVTNAGSQWAFNNQRSWLHLSGTIAGDYSYDVRHNLTAATSADAQWANGSMNLSDDWSLTAGTMKLASSREAMIGSQNQLTMDRQNINLGGVVIGGYQVGQGVQLGYTGDDLRFMGQMFNNFANTASAITPPANNDSSYAVNLRAEFMVEGSGWGQFDEFTSADGGAAGTLIGLSWMTLDDGDSGATQAAGNQTSGVEYWTIDAQMQFGGSNLYVSYADFSDSNTPNTVVVPAVLNTDSDTLTVMYGIYLDSDWELYGRYIDSDGSAAGPLNGSNVSIGLNNYLAGQNCKWTTEITWNDSAIETVANPNTDVTTISTQLQFYF